LSPLSPFLSPPSPFLSPPSPFMGEGGRGGEGNPTQILKTILAAPSVASKEWIIRQYDHEVQGGTVLKPLVGANCDGPGDAAVVLPVLGSHRGLAVGCGINPWYGDLDAYRWPPQRLMRGCGTSA